VTVRCEVRTGGMGDYDRTRGGLVWPWEVGCRRKDHMFAGYNGRKGRKFKGREGR